MLAERPLGLPLEFEERRPAGGRAYLVAKRAMDLIVALGALPLLVPFLGLVCLTIVATSKGWPLYRQTRVGKGGRLFRIWKLRTMVSGADRTGPNLTQESDPRVTLVGRFLRRWSLDELPQVINVLAGQMSLVGPRPELPTIVATYTSAQLDVLKVTPGITGWAQVNGRDDLTIPRKLELDREYVFSRSLAMDAGILLRTVPLFVSGVGIKR
jgi:lipopolysaccharide/colanic/teichoic acid biosynthesis glycosyltransferase